MQLEDYFSFLAPDDIRVKGTRVGIETILYEYIHRAQPPEAIAQAYSSVTLEQVYATILYYLHHEEAVTRYLADWLEFGRKAREEQDRNPGAQVARLLACAPRAVGRYVKAIPGRRGFYRRREVLRAIQQGR